MMTYYCNTNYLKKEYFDWVQKYWFNSTQFILGSSQVLGTEITGRPKNALWYVKG